MVRSGIPCCLCGSSKDDPLLYGDLLRRQNVACHHYCLLFSPALPQRGGDKEGLQGFILPDIRKEVKKSAARVCTYCRRQGAHSWCNTAKCSKRFHLSCALASDALLSFFGQYNVHCSEHRPQQRLPERRRAGPCSICLKPATDSATTSVLCTPCCGHSLHKLCLQKMALSSGYFFTCPICRDKNSRTGFLRHMKKFGVFIPQRDASWECTPNAFSELLVQHSGCDQKYCLCNSGRHYFIEGHRDWHQLLCGSCGSLGSHTACAGRSNRSAEPWYCVDCTFTFDNASTPPGQQKCTLRQLLMSDPQPPPDRSLADVFGALSWQNVLRALEDPRELLFFSCFRNTQVVTVCSRSVPDPRSPGYVIPGVWLPHQQWQLQPRVRVSCRERLAADRTLSAAAADGRRQLKPLKQTTLQLKPLKQTTLQLTLFTQRSLRQSTLPDAWIRRRDAVSSALAQLKMLKRPPSWSRQSQGGGRNRGDAGRKVIHDQAPAGKSAEKHTRTCRPTVRKKPRSSRGGGSSSGRRAAVAAGAAGAGAGSVHRSRLMSAWLVKSAS